MENCLGIISVGDGESNFGTLCINRPVYMLPFGGRYRLVDFTISNMVNHEIKTVAVYTGEKIRSTMDHLGNGKPWDLNRRFNGLFLFPPVHKGNAGDKEGDISEYYSTLDFFTLAKEKYVLIVHPNFLGSVNLSDAYKYFRETDADATIFYKKQVDPWGEYINCDKIHLNKDGSLLNMGVNLATEREFNMYIGMAFMKKDIFLDIVKTSMEKGNAQYLKHALLQNKDRYKVNTYEFKGHVENIRNLKSYYDANLNLLNRDISQELFFKAGPVFTKSKDEPSTFYTESARVQNSLIANGCVIEGTVENSVIFRGVNIGKNAIVKNSIIMQKSEIEDNTIVVNSILDKYAVIEEGVRIIGSSVMPYVVEKYQRIRKD